MEAFLIRISLFFARVIIKHCHHCLMMYLTTKLCTIFTFVGFILYYIILYYKLGANLPRVNFLRRKSSKQASFVLVRISLVASFSVTTNTTYGNWKSHYQKFENLHLEKICTHWKIPTLKTLHLAYSHHTCRKNIKFVRVGFVRLVRFATDWI